MTASRSALALALTVLGAGLAPGQDRPQNGLFPPTALPDPSAPRPAPPLGATPPAEGPAEPPSTSSLMSSLRTTLDSLGASSGVPDGVGATGFPTRPVAGQPSHVGLANFQAGLTLPVFDSPRETAVANFSLQALTLSGRAVLPESRAPLPPRLWDLQVGGTYARETLDRWGWGLALNAGSASDRPFATIHEATASAMAFLRVPRPDRDAWLFYVVSTTNGQVGHNIPVPGLAYELNRDNLSGVVGFPFINMTFRPQAAYEAELYYAAFTDLQTRLNYRPTDALKLFAGFAWTNHAWFRADRAHKWDQLFLYDKRVETGITWAPLSRARLQLSTGYAFDRYFAETAGASVRPRNRVDLGPGPFLSAQIELLY